MRIDFTEGEQPSPRSTESRETQQFDPLILRIYLFFIQSANYDAFELNFNLVLQCKLDKRGEY